MKKYLLTLAIAACICIAPNMKVSAQGENALPQATVTKVTMEMEWQRLNETWQNLSEREKGKLYKAREAVDKADCNFINKAVELKLIEKEIGERMKEHIKSRTQRIKEDGELPMFRKGIKGKQ